MASSSAATPPAIQPPTAKEKKYDRQLRLWAANGQRALEESHVLLIIPDTRAEGSSSSNSSAAGVETLKNLVLPRIGSFTIADSARVTEADLGINFFLKSQSLGQSRAEECRRLLEELNPDVTGHALPNSLSDLLTNPSWLLSYNLILCSPVPRDQRRIICEYAQQNQIPLIQIQSAGFYSAFTIQLPPAFPIVDTHPDPDSTLDLRLLSPWPELSAAVTALGDLEQLNDQDHGHVPYILLLLYYLKIWKENNDGKAPETFKEKTRFRDMIKAGARTENPEGSEENFEEAAAAVLKTIVPFSIKAGCREMFEMDSCKEVTEESESFWIIALAIKRFYHVHGVLPVPGSLPDMKAKSADYINLQNIYKAKAKKDLGEVAHNVRSMEEDLERTTSIPDEEIEAFCKSAAHVKVLEGKLLPQLRMENGDTQTSKQVLSEFQNAESLFPIMVAFQAGTKAELESMIRNGDNIDLDRINLVYEEIRRVGGRELHNISSLTGGLVAQEAIKIITRQYVPVNNICIFDGIKGMTQVFNL